MKIINCAVICILIITLAGCNPGTVDEGDSPEIPIMDNMRLEQTKESDEIGNTTPISTFVVENMELDSFLNEYEKTLNDSGWETIDRREPNTIEVEKEDFEATIIAYNEDGKTKVDIIKDND